MPMMRRFIDHITQFARSRTQAEWNELVFGKLVEVRTYVRENGEKAAGIGFILGILIVLFIKPFILLLAFSALIYLIIIALADV